MGSSACSCLLSSLCRSICNKKSCPTSREGLRHFPSIRMSLLRAELVLSSLEHLICVVEGGCKGSPFCLSYTWFSSTIQSLDISSLLGLIACVGPWVQAGASCPFADSPSSGICSARLFLAGTEITTLRWLLRCHFGEQPWIRTC